MFEVTQTTELMLIGFGALLMSLLIIARSHLRREEAEKSNVTAPREPR